MTFNLHQMLGVLVCLTFFFGCAPDEEIQNRGTVAITRSNTLTIFAAASLADAFQDIEHAFEALHTDTDVVLNLAGSQQLTQQLLLGAPADVFAPAHFSRMEDLVQDKRISAAGVQHFARNNLVVITPAENPAGLSSFQDLSQPGLKLVLAAPEVPAGLYTRFMLAQTSGRHGFPATFEQDVRARVVSYEQSVRAVRTKVILGEADAGIVYASDVSGTSNTLVKKITIPEAINVTAQYPIAPLQNSLHPELARAFIRFVISEAGQQILTRHGFICV